MKLQEKFLAIKLRKKGRSYSEIRKKIKVSKSTLTSWLRDIELSPGQKERLFVTLRQQNGYRLARLNRNKKKRETERIIAEAKTQLPLLFNNPLFISGLMLYWAEGDKSDEREVVKFSNSDSRMIAFMMRWFREICKIDNSKFRAAIHIHELHCRARIENYWSGITGIPKEQFHKTQIKPTSLGQRRNKLYDGTCAVVVNSRNLFRRIKGWRLGFIEKMNKIKE